MNSQGRLIVFAAPSGGGKGTIIHRLLERYPEWGFSCSATTRAPRPGEIDGKDYYFLSREEFQSRIDTGEFLEFEQVHGDLYGTLRSKTGERLAAGETVVFDLDVKGALNIKRAFPKSLLVFIMPPSLEVLEQRLRARETEGDDEIQLRLSRARMELELSRQFDVRVVNDNLDEALDKVDQEIKVCFADR